MGDIYKSQKDSYEKLYLRKEYKSLNMPDYKIVDQRETVGKKIAVLGAGTARDIRYLINENDVWGIDNSTKAVKILKTLGIKATLANLEEPLSLKSNFFDIVVAKDILEHLDNPSVLVSEIHRILKPTGYAVINVPNHFFLPMRLRIMLGKNLIWKTIDHNHTKLFDEWNYIHKIFFTWKGFQKFLKVHRFKIIKEFWDFGTLVHYSQPEIVFTKLEQEKKFRSKKTFILIAKYLWRFFNIVFPRKIRSAIVRISPSLLCASFYIWCKPINK